MVNHRELRIKKTIRFALVSLSTTNIPPIFQSFDSLLIVLLSIFIPIAFICLLILIIYCCCHNQKSSSIKNKSSHILSSTIHHNITSSSSSSTNTNLTNIYQRQIFRKTDPSKYLPSVGNSLCEIPFTNIRFLQEIGEGKNKYLFNWNGSFLCTQKVSTL
jgi:hypothetical protein